MIRFDSLIPPEADRFGPDLLGCGRSACRLYARPFYARIVVRLLVRDGTNRIDPSSDFVQMPSQKRDRRYKKTLCAVRGRNHIPDSLKALTFIIRLQLPFEPRNQALPLDSGRVWN